MNSIGQQRESGDGENPSPEAIIRALELTVTSLVSSQYVPSLSL